MKFELGNINKSQQAKAENFLAGLDNKPVVTKQETAAATEENFLKSLDKDEKATSVLPTKFNLASQNGTENFLKGL